MKTFDIYPRHALRGLFVATVIIICFLMIYWGIKYGPEIDNILNTPHYEKSINE